MQKFSVDSAETAAGFLKSLSHPDRLKILCLLASCDEQPAVADIAAATGLKPSTLSQHLAKLRQEGIVTYRREHRTLYYRFSSQTAQDIINALKAEFCSHS